jgi:hypothetical protein
VLVLGQGGATPARAQPAADICGVLDNPAALLTLSGAGQNFLMHQCGLLPRAPAGEGEVVPPVPALGPALGLDVGPVNNPATDAHPNETQSETTIDDDPSYGGGGQVLCTGWNDSMHWLANSTFTGFGRSATGGTTWTDQGFVAPPAGGMSGGDPVIKTDPANDRFYFSHLASLATGRSVVAVTRSTDGCQSFPAANLEDATGGGTLLGDFQDKPWIDVDTTGGAGAGNVYACWTEFFDGNKDGDFADPVDLSRIRFNRRVGGAWGAAPVTIASSPAGQFAVQGCQVAVGPGGEAYVAWWQGDAPAGSRIMITKSTDQGVTFPAGNLKQVSPAAPFPGYTEYCTPYFRPALNGPIRIFIFPSLAVNPVSGDVYVAWNHNVNPDIFFSSSVNGGANWSAAAMVNNDGLAGRDQFMPAMEVADDGSIIKVHWYDRRGDPSNLMLEQWEGMSLNGGVTWANLPVSDVAFGVPPTNPNFDTVVANCYMGDYDGTAVNGRTFYLTWGDNRTNQAGHVPPHLDPNVYFDREVPSVGGVAELPDIAGTAGNQAAAPDGGSGWSAGAYAALAAAGAAALTAIGAGVVYARRRWLR